MVQINYIRGKPIRFTCRTITPGILNWTISRYSCSGDACPFGRSLTCPWPNRHAIRSDKTIGMNGDIFFSFAEFPRRRKRDSTFQLASQVGNKLRRGAHLSKWIKRNPTGTADGSWQHQSIVSRNYFFKCINRCKYVTIKRSVRFQFNTVKWERNKNNLQVQIVLI